MRLANLAEEVMKDGKVNVMDLPLLMDVTKIVPGILELKNAGKEFTDLDDEELAELHAYWNEVAADMGLGVIGNISQDVLDALAGIGNVIEGVLKLKQSS